MYTNVAVISSMIPQVHVHVILVVCIYLCSMGLSIQILSCMGLSIQILSCMGLSIQILSCMGLSIQILSCMGLSIQILSCMGLSIQILSCMGLSIQILTCTHVCSPHLGTSWTTSLTMSRTSYIYIYVCVHMLNGAQRGVATF